MKTQDQTIEWYISAVKANLVLNFEVMEDEANEAIERFGLREKIMADPEEELTNSIEGMAETIARYEFVGRSSQLTYKGFFTNVLYDTRMRSLYGKVYGTPDFISFEAKNPELVEDSFHRAVDEYLEFQKNKAQEPNFSQFSFDTENFGVNGSAANANAGASDFAASDLSASSIAMAGAMESGFLDENPNYKKVTTIDDNTYYYSQTERGCIMDHYKTSVLNSDAAPEELLANSEAYKKHIEGADEDAEFLRSMGIDPDEDVSVLEMASAGTFGGALAGLAAEETDGDNEAEQTSFESAQLSVESSELAQDSPESAKSDEDLLRSMGIDPDEVILEGELYPEFGVLPGFDIEEDKEANRAEEMQTDVENAAEDEITFSTEAEAATESESEVSTEAEVKTEDETEAESTNEIEEIEEVDETEPETPADATSVEEGITVEEKTPLEETPVEEVPKTDYEPYSEKRLSDSEFLATLGVSSAGLILDDVEPEYEAPSASEIEKAFRLPETQEEEKGPELTVKELAKAKAYEVPKDNKLLEEELAALGDELEALDFAETFGTETDEAASDGKADSDAETAGASAAPPAQAEETADDFLKAFGIDPDDIF